MCYISLRYSTLAKPSFLDRICSTKPHLDNDGCAMSDLGDCDWRLYRINNNITSLQRAIQWFTTRKLSSFPLKGYRGKSRNGTPWTKRFTNIRGLETMAGTCASFSFTLFCTLQIRGSFSQLRTYPRHESSNLSNSKDRVNVLHESMRSIERVGSLWR